MALDAPNGNDVDEDVDGIQFFMEKPLADQVKSVKVDLSYMGFSLDPEVPLAQNGGGGCSSGCGGCN